MSDVHIYYACESVRIFLLLHAASNKGSEAQINVESLRNESTIRALISQQKWDELFKNEKWLSLLGDAVSLNTLTERISKELEEIAESFPKETAGIIFPETLK